MPPKRRPNGHARYAPDHGAQPSPLVPRSLQALPSYDGGGTMRVVVESPAGSRVKLKYDAGLGAFVLSRTLVVGVAYPFDWGFVPGTTAADGDPVDAMILLDAPTYPGVVVPVYPVALLKVRQDSKDRRAKERNDRLLVRAVNGERSPELSKRMRRELEHYFHAATALQDKNVEILGWAGPDAAHRLVRRARAR